MKFLKFISIIVIFIIMFSFNISYASSISDVITGGDDFIKAGSTDRIRSHKITRDFKCNS